MRKLYYLAACLLALCTSCSDWLDVKPKTNVEEEDLFKNEQGFKEALTGIYIKMSETQLYGRELTYGFLSQLAQNYLSDGNELADYYEDTWYTYPSTRTETYINDFWTEG